MCVLRFRSYLARISWRETSSARLGSWWPHTRTSLGLFPRCSQSVTLLQEKKKPQINMFAENAPATVRHPFASSSFHPAISAIVWPWGISLSVASTSNKVSSVVISARQKWMVRTTLALYQELDFPQRTASPLTIPVSHPATERVKGSGNIFKNSEFPFEKFGSQKQVSNSLFTNLDDT